MNLKPESRNLNDYLENTPIIDFHHHAVQKLARRLKTRSRDKIELIRNTFEYVRDEIRHSADYNGQTVTCAASRVLEEKEGICYAKSHLLAALLRCNGIPAGFCYQKLVLDDETGPELILHGLNGVYIEEMNQWIRLDARGNNENVNARFSLTEEKLAFPVRPEMGEKDYPVIFTHPDKNILKALNTYENPEELYRNLPHELTDRPN